jgi:hypothetical protein
MRLFLAVIFVSSVGITPSVARDIDGEFVVFNSGTNTCTDFLSARHDGNLRLEPYHEWLSGYLSAFNLIVVNTYDITGDSNYIEIIRWLDQYCQQNQDLSFANASAALTMALYPERRNLAPKKNTNYKRLGDGLFSAENFIKQ